ncbi:hypothetical protein KCP75_10690 [Salmonella enterica subsp. enterica]|nr:hypothetical protein KCP75_10690 [Salmonella enterica subsp. enterica]
MKGLSPTTFTRQKRINMPCAQRTRPNVLYPLGYARWQIDCTFRQKLTLTRCSRSDSVHKRCVSALNGVLDA